ncbi:MAG: zinc ribbon domain-containing protein [Acidobacteria bacterium]|nr:zinc ribbon domain-containing protein [Acidobacteriota bacterium]
MHCPQCGQQQVPGEVRFCSRCGFPLGTVNALVANGGVLPKQSSPGDEQLSPRRRGVKQGVTLIMLGIVLTSLFGAFNSYLHTPELFTVISAIIGFVGGPLRILYALIFEESAKKYYTLSPNYLPPHHVPAPFAQPPHQAALPPGQQQPQHIPSFRQHTSEIIQPPGSVTENTTRLLEKEPDKPER